MRYGSVKHIALYYKAIPGMLRLMRQERAELEGNYYGLRGLACDGMPRGSSPGKPTEESGLRDSGGTHVEPWSRRERHPAALCLLCRRGQSRPPRRAESPRQIL